MSERRLKQIQTYLVSDKKNASGDLHNLLVSFFNDYEKENDFASEVSKELMCACCHGILFQPYTLTPCGHSFCKTCVFEVIPLKKPRYRVCPLCRYGFYCTVPNVVVSGTIQAMIASQNSSGTLQYFSSDDIHEYRERVASARLTGNMEPRDNTVIKLSSVELSNTSPVWQSDNRSQDMILDMETSDQYADELLLDYIFRQS